MTEKRIKVLMLQGCRGTEDGWNIRQFEQGQVYEIEEWLAKSFFAAGFCINEGGKNARRKDR